MSRPGGRPQYAPAGSVEKVTTSAPGSGIPPKGHPDRPAAAPADDIDRRLRTDLATRAAYSGDASVYRRLPAAVLEPRTEADIVAALALARRKGWAVVGRGGGTSVAGNAIGDGLVLDHSRYHQRVLAIDADTASAEVEPGVICDDLRAAAAAYGLTYGPDPSTHSRCTIGGMVGNNACGSHSVAWGTSAENLRSVRMVLADGRILEAWRGGCSDPQIEAALRTLAEGHRALLRTELGRFSRQVSGYGLHYLLPEHGFDVAKALAGSEGTCGIFTRLSVDLVRPPKARALVVLGYPDIFTAAEAATGLRRPGVLTIEGMGADLIAALRTRPGRAGAGDQLPDGQAWLYCEVAGEDAEDAATVAEKLVGEARARSSLVLTDAVAARELWRIREAAAGIATRRADGGEAWPGWEDSAVPPAHLADYLRDLYALMARHRLAGIPFGHFGEGCIHIRIDFDLRSDAGIARYREFIEAAADLVHRHGGSVSGEHGDGRARSELLPRIYSAEMIRLFAQFKAIFDPEHRLNPGVLVAPERLDSRMRPGPALATHDRRPVHALSRDDGSLTRAFTRCVGVGSCRSDEGAMCPSFQATRDEVASTRGRARVLAEMLRGEHLRDGWRSTAVRDALDLCLSCKACATECPVNVDMATYKAEFLHRHYRHRLRPRAHYTMGWLPVASAAVSAVPGLGGLANRTLARPGIAALVKRVGGIEPRRDLVSFAPVSLARWHARRAAPPAPPPGAPVVVLWPDTFTNHLAPEVGVDAVESLEALGHDVRLPSRPVCCGLTWHSTGQLDVARAALRRTLNVLAEDLAAGHRIVGLEPSCTVLLTEAAELLPGDGRAQALQRAMTTLAQAVLDAPGPWPFGRLDVDAISQVHCHQQSQGDYSPDLEVLERLGVRARPVGQGCCGVAGNFGFEPGHYEVSTAVAERALYPAIEQAEDALVLADGYSCRTQIAQGTPRTGRHLAQILRVALPR